MGRYFDGGTSIAIAVILALFLHSAGAQTSPTDGSTRNPYSYGHFTPSMIILLAIFISVVFLMLFFAIYIRHCSAAARGTLTPSGIGTRITNLRGLDPAILNTFPTFSYSEVKLHKIGKGALECAVCLTEFADEETLRFLPKCDHVFHHDCIDLWFASHSTCPVCRANLDQPSVEAAQSIEIASERLPNGLNRDEPITDIPELPRSFDVMNAEKPLMLKDGFISFSKFPKSHSTGHCLVQPGENMDRFTLRLPIEIRNKIMNRVLARSTSVVVLPTANSFRKGYRDEGNGAGGSMDRITEEPWWWSGLFVRNGSSTKPGFGGEGTSRIMGLVRQMSRKGFGSRKDWSGSVRKSTRPEV